MQQGYSWNNLTERARRAMFFAQEEAKQYGHPMVLPEHILLGLLHDKDNVSERILNRIDVTVERIRQELDPLVARRRWRRGQGERFSPESHRVIEAAYSEAETFNNNYVGTEHLLLGLLHENKSLAGKVLLKLGADLKRTRREIRNYQTGIS